MTREEKIQRSMRADAALALVFVGAALAVVLLMAAGVVS